MNENTYFLMHRDDPVCVAAIDSLSGTMTRVSQKRNTDLLPIGGSVDVDMLRKWWQRRAVPISQGKMKRILEQLGIPTPQNYLVRNLGLSLTDHYWIKPLDLDLGWSDVNLFTNSFRDPIADYQMEDIFFETLNLPENAFSPSSTTQGDLQKKWIIADGKRCLVKGNHGSNSQESLNEAAASLLHKKQGYQPFVDYRTIQIGKDSHFFSICESFTSDSIEFIPAIEIVDSQKRDNACSLYEHFIQVCVSHGMIEKKVRDFLEYQILADFLLTNTDRHLNNFGILRDSNSLQWLGMAPIFDSGCSMFWNNPRLPEHDALTDIRVNSFRKTEKQLLDYIRDWNHINMGNLPTEDELSHIYEVDPLIPCLDSILLGYRKKIDMLSQFISIQSSYRVI